jgi:uncharacterized protein DUF5996
MEALSPLPLDDWRATRDRLHGWARLAGAARRQCSPKRKHWWHTSLLPTARGLATGPFATADATAEIELLLRRGELRLSASDGRDWRLPLAGDPAGAGREALMAALAALGVDVGLPMVATVAGEYEPHAAARYLDALLAVGAAFRRLQAELPLETSPIQLWPHHFDLAMTWLSGRVLAGKEDATEAEDRDETITLGFSTGDDGDAEPYLYAIAHPWPAGAEMRPLEVGRWHSGGWNGGYLAWADAVASGAAEETVLAYARETRALLSAAQAEVRPPAAR